MRRRLLLAPLLLAIACSESEGYPWGDCPDSECQSDEDCGEGMTCRIGGFECTYHLCVPVLGGAGGAGGRGGIDLER
ncbi:MAG: hypothetical protein JRE81_15265 [Deltaproteobacteria bacterium]|nr:hypothetical protein [Deltaproteobacteria bacterium]